MSTTTEPIAKFQVTTREYMICRQSLKLDVLSSQKMHVLFVCGRRCPRKRISWQSLYRHNIWSAGSLILRSFYSFFPQSALHLIANHIHFSLAM